VTNKGDRKRERGLTPSAEKKMNRKKSGDLVDADGKREKRWIKKEDGVW